MQNILPKIGPFGHFRHAHRFTHVRNYESLPVGPIFRVQRFGNLTQGQLLELGFGQLGPIFFCAFRENWPLFQLRNRLKFHLIGVEFPIFESDHFRIAPFQLKLVLARKLSAMPPGHVSFLGSERKVLHSEFVRMAFHERGIVLS